MTRLARLAVVLVCVDLFALASFAPARAAEKTEFRPPAVPLVTFDPYLSVWSEADRLTDDATRHWTRHPHSLTSLIRVDGKAYRLMGKEPTSVPALPQVSLKVLPTRTIYVFANDRVRVEMTFMTAALPDDLEVFARPLSYITWQVRSGDGAQHEVQIYQSVSSQLAVHDLRQKVVAGFDKFSPLTALHMGSEEQPMLARMGDDTRIDWGRVYLAGNDCKGAIGDASADLEKQFVERGSLVSDYSGVPRAVANGEPAVALVFGPSNVGNDDYYFHAIVAYDEIYAIKFFGKKLRPYWRRNGAEVQDLLQAAEKDYPSLVKRCEAFDDELMADLTKVGGPRYAQIAALAYRQCIAACGLAADANKQPLLFTKENTSNGDIATVDVIYPMDPIFVFLSPTLAKASLAPVLTYAASDHWKYRCAPHDLGTYPVCMGRDDGGEAMPVEESGNMILLCDAIAKTDGNADFVAPWWPQLTTWAKFLEKYGLDPENQLCTDDFMGHLAHNANLSVKAILALAAYGDLCRMRGDTEAADRYTQLAKADAIHWLKAADDGDHYRLAFDKPDTWSQKYNLVWDKLLGLNVFPPSVAGKEIAFYKKHMQPYGLPLDSRTHLTKTDWTLWSATLAENDADFQTIVSPVYDYLNETTARDPLADSYETDNVKSNGMHARPVVGGLFIKMLSDEKIWKKWAARDRFKAGPWAPLPVPPKVVEIVPTAQHETVQWQYTFKQPPKSWNEPLFDAGRWKTGPGGFGTRGTPNAVVGTEWNTDDIWLRREFTMPEGEHSNLQLIVYHDEDVEIYINGVLAGSEGGFDNNYKPLEIRPLALKLLKPGAKIVMAVHCHQTEGGQGVDVGLADVTECEASAAQENTPEQLFAQIEKLKLGGGGRAKDFQARMKASREMNEAIIDATEKILAANPTAEQRVKALKIQLTAFTSQPAYLMDDIQADQLEKLGSALKAANLPKEAGQAKMLRLEVKLQFVGNRPQELKKTVAEIKDFFATEPADPGWAMLATRAAMRLEGEKHNEFAIETYRDFAKIFAAQKDQRVAAYAATLEGAARRLELPKTPMRVEGTTLDGKPLDWSKYSGKIVLVDFWATWCGPCRAELPNVKKAYEKYHGRGFEVVGISLDSRRDNLDKFMANEKLPWEIVLDDSWNKDKKASADSKTVVGANLARYYGIFGIPTAILLGKDGRAVSLNARGEVLNRELEKLLGPAEVKKD